MGHYKSSLINGEHLSIPNNVVLNAVLCYGMYGNPQEGYVSHLQRLSERNAIMRKRQSDLHGNMQKSAEMTDSAKRVFDLIQENHINGNMSLRDVAKKLGMQYGAMQWFIRKYDMPHRSRIESMKRCKDGHGPQWKGGRTIFVGNRDKKTPYVYIYNPRHSNANSRGYVFEHRLVMAELLGRPIRKDEVIHHRNGDSLDNRPENLEVRQRGGADQYHGPLRACPYCGHDLP
jgi:HNH endonuclease